MNTSAADDPLDKRIEMLRRMTKGKMPVRMVVADVEAKKEAELALSFKSGVSNIKVETRAEFNAARPEHLQERH